MHDPADPYQNLPDLADMIVDPGRSAYRNIDFAALDRKMAERGALNWRRTDEDREATRKAVLGERWNDDLWVFGYASLMWDPGFHFAEARRATAEGYRRRFCLKTTLGRGTPEKPGLMAALDAGGRCEGLAFRIAQPRVEEETRILWAREMIMPAYDPRFIALSTPQGPIDALAFVINHEAENYLHELSLEETARCIGTGVGVFGRNIDYLENIVAHLAAFDIEDKETLELHRLARQIAGVTGGADSGAS